MFSVEIDVAFVSQADIQSPRLTHQMPCPRISTIVFWQWRQRSASRLYANVILRCDPAFCAASWPAATKVLQPIYHRTL